MSIHRIKPRTATQAFFCQECHTDKRKGYWLYWPDMLDTALFVCEECMAMARQHEFIDNGKPQIGGKPQVVQVRKKSQA